MKITKKTLAPIILFVIAIVLIVIQWLSTGASGETDSISHYQFARYAFKYPEFFLNHWGKPLFTILSAPLAQFGYTGAIVFNLICGLASAWFVYLTGRRLDIRHSWAAIILTVFTPVYLFIMYSSLTETLFSLVLIAAIYLFISKRFILSAIVISLIPFARTEGVMFVLLFIPALLWMKQYKSLPFLLTGMAIFSLAGLPYYHDLLWFFTRMPYNTNSADLYGSGSFWTYFNELDYILNYPLLILVITGLVFTLLDLKKGLKNLHDIKYATLYFLVLPSLFGFIFAQSYLWWKGLGILASIRFMACVVPLSALLALTGFEWVMEKARPMKIIYYLIGAYILGLVIYKPFTYNVIPSKTGINFAVMEQLAAWLKDSPYQNRKAVYTDPMFPFYMDRDPFDSRICQKKYSFENIDPATLLKPGELLVWDAHFSGYEGHLPFDTLMNNINMRLIKTFHPVDSFKIIGGANYKVALFMKAPKDTNRTVYQPFFFNDFERGLSEKQIRHISLEHSKSGKQSIQLTPENIYSPAAEDKLIYLPDTCKISVKASVQILNPFPAEKGQVLLVLSVDDSEKKVFRYYAVKDSEKAYKPGEWFELTLTGEIDRNIPVDGTYKVYVWYKGKNKVYVDDLKLEFIPVASK